MRTLPFDDLTLMLCQKGLLPSKEAMNTAVAQDQVAILIWLREIGVRGPCSPDRVDENTRLAPEHRSSPGLSSSGVG